ncbi:hypothetical protein KC19_VG071500 [Ceratodon purpureus]|uniref:Uncharacterized protein n=1 Tax=Ceratodon purpureus TaxID=3225 RepID=A0A8T0HMT8_CERPU|nr:hypothetical protein KC19_VG071500 [Ceratodon purpureus]
MSQNPLRIYVQPFLPNHELSAHTRKKSQTVRQKSRKALFRTEQDIVLETNFKKKPRHEH